MSFERFIAKRFLPKDRNSYSGPLVGIATYSIALGVLVMIMAVSILRGFQSEIRHKVVGFGSHIVVTSYAMGNINETTPVSTARPEVQRITSTPGVKHLNFFASKGGMIKTDDQIHGIIFKGVDAGYDSSFFAENLQEGHLVQYQPDKPSNQVIVSRNIANKLQLSLGSKVRTYFWQGDSYRARAFEVCGIYNTDLTDFDEHYIIGDMRQVQRLNDWDSLQCDGYEILVDNFSHLEEVSQMVLAQLSYDLTLNTIIQQNPALFSWLDLLDSNIILIIIIMMMVCTVSIISALLIMIFEKTSTIGLLKALGSNNRSIRKIFLLKSSTIIASGILLGDAVAFLLCWIQHQFGIFRLDSNSYMMDTVPIDLNPVIFLSISIATLVVCLLALLIPTTYISHIHPAQSIKFD
ncbi:MAG: ABC transporter permease [Bacteroidales bacterium]|nr:ABC transporter permease [Candidatus Colimorpha merdihippi]